MNARVIHVPTQGPKERVGDQVLRVGLLVGIDGKDV